MYPYVMYFDELPNGMRYLPCLADLAKPSSQPVLDDSPGKMIRRVKLLEIAARKAPQRQVHIIPVLSGRFVGQVCLYQFLNNWLINNLQIEYHQGNKWHLVGFHDQHSKCETKILHSLSPCRLIQFHIFPIY